jgi:23S rRNA pseudouridine1911/1915/1917 synthase
MDELLLKVDDSEGRLDRYIASRCPHLSRSLVQRLISEGQVLVNGAQTKASYCPIPGDIVLVRIPSKASTMPQAEYAPLCILFEDRYMLVIDKPAGIVVHPGVGHPNGTLVNALLAHLPDLLRADLDPQRPGVVHRLDRDTSGVLVIAATREAQSALQAQFKAHQVRKTYLALLYGHLSPSEGAIEAPIGRDPGDRKRMGVLPEGGRYARTEYRVRELLPGCSLVEARPITGRTHQLRVHFRAIDHPVVGDRVYGYRRGSIALPRQFLHAWRLALVHPVSGAVMEFTSELPADLAAVLAALRAQADRI